MKSKLVSLFLFGFACTAAASAVERPNIIFLLADDQNFASIGIYGNPEVETPNMDQLGQDGLIFDKHYNTTAICMASRASIFTGMYEYKTGTNFQHTHMRQEIWKKSYPILLREAGYTTAFAGKFGLDVYGYGKKGKKGVPAEDFDIWGGSPGQSFYETAKNESMAKYAKDYPHSTLSYAAFSRDVIREAAKSDKPFCLSVSFKAPHLPATPDPKFADVYAGKTFTKPANFGREFGEYLSPQSKTGRQWERFTTWKYDTNYDEVMATYYQQIYAIDVAIGQIREELAAQGLEDNTVIIYTSDNGYLCGAHGYGSKVLPLEESSRAPLMIYDPRNPNAGKGLRTRSLTGNIDFAATILDLAGVSAPDNMDGVSLLPLLDDANAELHEQLAFTNVYGDVPTKNLTVITKDLKYTYWWYGDDTMEPTEDLFNVSKDPMEFENLAHSPEAEPMMEEMRRKYDEELALWKAQAEPAYTQYGRLFDRNIPADQKKFKLTKGQR